MNYLIFLLKKGLKSKLALLSVVLTIIVVSTCLFFNLRNQHVQTFESRAQEQILFDIRQKKHYTPKEIKQDPHDAVSLIDSDIQVNKKIQKLLHKRKW
ncbi:hypothetical protein G8J22_00088 [Lentilactobacillus hilgardii]|nr:hypothetical protein [Lentilactobacillus hilgardii]EEI20846.1 hypothetical protein HMPREF0497_0361 [Lentilactobacillus buchneri ATCC 11577]MCT3395110.1 hypothetical protein [Lentilactobacillus hilgardii]QIR08154.1 hypothetical protein G8J22_00088 [Lentilactobacillus hilgardii]